MEKIGKSRGGLPYWIDGAVIKLDSFDKRREAGETGKHPKWAIAFKFPPEEKETVVRKIILQTGRTGRVTPVAILDPVFLAGTSVKKATLHNQQIINKLGLNEGDTVVVRKAAEIIPEIVRVAKKAEPWGETGSQDVYNLYSQVCPSCGMPIYPNEDETGAYCANIDCRAQMFRKFTFWASRDCMNIDGLGDAKISAFITAGCYAGGIFGSDYSRKNRSVFYCGGMSG